MNESIQDIELFGSWGGNVLKFLGVGSIENFEYQIGEDL